MRRLILAVSLLSVASAKDKPTYPEHGTVLAMRTDRVAHSGGVYTDPYGKTHGGVVSSRNVPVFTIRAKGIDYGVEGRRDLAIDQEVDFRIEKHRIYIQRGDKEDRYFIVDEEKSNPVPAVNR